MLIYSLITARSGSKGIKDKKLRNAYKYKEVINKFIKDIEYENKI
mgnify:CR=1 FL=1